jgi:hypothetical protein
MRTGNIMIGAVAKRISSKFEEGDRVKIAKEYGGGTGKIIDVRGSFITIKTTKRGDEIHHSSNLKVINGIGAVKSGRISFDGKRRFFYDDGTLFGDFVGVLSDRSYKKIVADPKNSEIVTTKLKAWAKRNGYRYSKGFNKNKQYGVR